jgi:hypothetical protein
MRLSRELFLQGKDQYSWPPPCTNEFRSAPFYFFNERSYLNKEVNCTEPSPLERVPWAEIRANFRWHEKVRKENERVGGRENERESSNSNDDFRPYFLS